MKIRTLALTGTTILAACLAATFSLAQGGPGRMTGGSAAGGRIVERFQLADTDKDGFVSRSEADKALPQMALRFDALDRDRDGKLSPAELQAMRAIAQGSMRPTQAGAGMGRGAARGGGGRGAGAGCLQADADGNGLVSRDEASRMGPRLNQSFAALDTDKDGQLSRQELQAHCPATRL